MKQLVKKVSFLLCLFVMLFVADYGYSQGTAGQHNPYQNLGVYKIYNNNWQYPGTLPPEYSWSNEDDWYGTQSMPTAKEKAEWALDDINDYRAENGLPPLTKTIFVAMPREDAGVPIIAGVLLGILFLIGLILLLKSGYDMYQDRKDIKSRLSGIDKKIEKDKERFADLWKQMTEERRRNNIGLFIQKYGREPKDGEIVTGTVLF
jgi:hypothetical protein